MGNLQLRSVDDPCEQAWLSEKDLSLLAAARHPDPAAVLGPHLLEGGRVVVRCWVSGAEEVALSSPSLVKPKDKETKEKAKEEEDVTNEAEKTCCEAPHEVPLRRRGPDGAAWLFEAQFQSEGDEIKDTEQLRQSWNYELIVKYAGGLAARWHDPYRFGALLSEDVLQAWAAGKPVESPARTFGSHHMQLRESMWGTRFAIWAPHAAAVSVVGDFNFWDGRSHPMCRRAAFGIWELFLPVWDLRGKEYGYQIVPRESNGDAAPTFFVKTDPFAQEFVEPTNGGHNAKVTEFDDFSRAAWRGSFFWKDASWMKTRAEKFSEEKWSAQPLSIYEVHLGSWASQYKNYKALADPLAEHVSKLGFTAVEFLPVSQYPSEESWGYQCAAGLYAVDSRLGTPDDFRWLVDTLHLRGIAVYVDFVGAHFAKDEWGLVNYSGAPQFEYEGDLGSLADWGTARYDFSKPEVRAYLLGAAEYWLDQYHVDGLRLDAVAAMVYKNFGKESDGDEILAGRGVRNEDGISLLREMCSRIRTNYPGVLVMAEESTNFHWVTARPAAPGTERAHQGGEDLGFHLKWNMGYSFDTLAFMGSKTCERPSLESFGHKKLAFYLQYAHNERWILPFSHDNVHHRGLLEQCTASCEAGDAEKQFAQLRAMLAFTVGMPGRPLLFMASEVGEGKWSFKEPIDWTAAATDSGKVQLMNWVSKLMHLYRRQPALHRADDEQQSFQWLDVGGYGGYAFAWRRSVSGERDAVVFVNFGADAIERYEVSVESSEDAEGCWVCVADSAAVAEDADAALKSPTHVVNNGSRQLATKLEGFSAQIWLAPTKMVNVKMQLIHPKREPGRIIRVVGSCKELGDWRPEAGAELKALKNGEEEAEGRPVEVSLCLPRRYGTVEFKFVVMASGDSPVTWEPIEGNRRLHLLEASGDEPSSIATTFGDARLHEWRETVQLPTTST
eukprot:TRINITY_DN39381_c0_g1_i1.p1 TRINITY_DN39381_c0_g1~~TRINITY_DN39381_c0_g1_i1.p1  ORF type:complete len:950 (+),score=232.77 TRINITY_DN39381_c0_g1_i1:118-2967(+)